MENIENIKERGFNRRVPAQITIETAIVMPIVIMVITGFLYMSLYIHDVIAIKSSLYRVGIESVDKEFSEFQDKVNNKEIKIPLFVLKVHVSCEEERDKYIIEANVKSESNIKWMNNVANAVSNTYEIKVEKNMSRETLYVVGAIKKEILK